MSKFKAEIYHYAGVGSKGEFSFTSLFCSFIFYACVTLLLERE